PPGTELAVALPLHEPRGVVGFVDLHGVARTRAREKLPPFVPVVGVQAAIDQDRDAAERPFEAQVIGVLVSARVMPGTEQQVVVGCRGFFAEMRAEYSPA